MSTYVERWECRVCGDDGFCALEITSNHFAPMNMDHSACMMNVRTDQEWMLIWRRKPEVKIDESH